VKENEDGDEEMKNED